MQLYKYLIFIFASSVVLASAEPTGAQCTFPVPSRSINDPYDYMRSVIEALSFAHQANSWVKSDSPPAQLLLQLMRSRNDYKCAADMIEKFQASTDIFIHKTALAIYAQYYGISQLYEKNISALTQVLDRLGKVENPPFGSAMKEFAELSVAREEELEVLGQVTVQSTYSLLEWTDYTPKGKPTGSLRITETRRQDLIKQIEKEFGSTAVRSGPKPGPQPALEVAAIVLYRWISDAKWRSADSKQK